MRAHHPRPSPPWLGFILVSLGAGLLARELGWLPPRVRVLDFWPLFVVMMGLSLLTRRSGWLSALLALAFISTGGALLAANLGFLEASVTRLWPLLLVLLGVGALTRRDHGPVRRRDDTDRGLADPEDELLPALASFSEQLTEQDLLDRQFTCAGAQLRVESQAWAGGSIGVLAGGVELDLRQARLLPGGAILELRVLMGGVDIRVPDTWRVQLDVVPLLGGADDTTRSTQGTDTAPYLRIIGKVTLGGVTVQN